MVQHRDSISRIVNQPPLAMLMDDLRAGLSRFFKTAHGILAQTRVALKAPAAEDLSADRNFFSLLFLYSFHRAGITRQRRIFYAAALQCLRGMVTGCDNLLDDEYKKTFDSDLPQTAFRFRSVVDIMVSDRVLFELLLQALRRREINADTVSTAAAASMRTMIRSGIQEASEEGGITAILAPEEILENVHRYKTGILFTCPWDIPLAIGEAAEADIRPLLEGLYRIGMGCQILDDMADFESDLLRRRHNFMVSLAYHGAGSEKGRLEDLVAAAGRSKTASGLASDFPDSLSKATATAQQFLDSGLTLLFSEEHRAFVKPSIRFLKERIGGGRLSGCLGDDD